ncbi:hypothetical protein [Candidatus Amarolinea dominans]
MAVAGAGGQEDGGEGWPGLLTVGEMSAPSVPTVQFVLTVT